MRSVHRRFVLCSNNSQIYCGYFAKILWPPHNELFYEDSENDVDHEDKKHFIYQSISTFDEFIPSHHTDSGDLNNHSGATKVKDQSERVHEENGYLDCKICKLSFPSKKKLNTHIDAVHTYKVKNQIDRVHEEKTQFDCGICKLSLSSKKQLNTHIYTVHIKTDSEDMDNQSGAPKVKNQIERVDEEKNQFDCGICELPFSTMQRLNTHIYAVHNNKVEYQIEKVHEEKNQFDCGICELPFSSKQRLNTHIYTVHVKTEILFGKKGCSTTYVCKHCTSESPFESFSEVENHMEKAHGVRMQDKNVTAIVKGTGNSTKGQLISKANSKLFT